MKNANAAAAADTRRAPLNFKEGFAKFLFFVCACLSIIAVFGIVGFVLYGSVPAFRDIGVFQFIFGTSWNPNYDRYGILPMIVNSLIVTLFSVLLGGIVGIFTAVFLAFWCPDKIHINYRGNDPKRAQRIEKINRVLHKINLRTIFDQIIKLLAGIPSIVYGLFGLEIIVQMLSGMNGGRDGKGILACSLLLAIMVLPTVTSLVKNALEAVPESYLEGALALGNSKAQAVFCVVLPAARSGIISALILALGRAVGEAMAVIWVSGNRALFPSGLFSNIRTMTTNIVMEMGYATGLHQSALLATGFVLLVFVLIITLSMNFVPKEYRGGKGTRALLDNTGEREIPFRKQGALQDVLFGISVFFAALVALILAIIIFYIVINGIVNFSVSFITSAQAIDVPTLMPSLLATLELVGITLAIALPLGICAAIFLNEYAKPGSKVIKVIRTFIDTLSGVPSIVFGLFGMMLFRNTLGMGRSVLVGALTLVIVVLPTIIRSTEESLHAVPMSLREASYGLGASKVRTIFRIVLPSAIPGIATAAILAIGRIIGESAALVFTMGTAFTFYGDPSGAGSSLAVLLYTCANEGLHMGEAYMTAFILLIFAFVLNIIVYLIQRGVRKKRMN